ncbi:unnamed protein product [Discosporangium mesarthrocarpum]
MSTFASAASSSPSSQANEGRKRWFPLESNPGVMNKYVEKMGWPIEKYRFVDVFSTEDWALGMVPQPVLGVMMLFPIKEATEKHRKEEAASLLASGQAVKDKVYFMKQTVGNACGTVGLLHCTLNASISHGIELAKDSFLQRFLGKTRGMSADQMARALHDEEELEVVHEEAAQEGQSEQKDRDEKINTHFVCLTEVDGILYELDGRKEGPISHGPTSEATLLQDCCVVVKKFMDRDPGELRFTIVALAPATDFDT